MFNLDLFNKKVGLSLSGGGIKSYSQYPIIEFLYAKKIKINYFAGTSMGAVIATLLAAGLSCEALAASLLRLEKQFEAKKVLVPHIPHIAMNKHNGFIDGNKLENILEEEFQRHNITLIENIKAHLFIIAVDILTSRIVIFASCKHYKSTIPNSIVIKEGKLSQIVRASCSIPVLFSSYDLRDLKLVDGGILMNLPVTPLLDAGVKKIISISMLSETAKSECKTIVDIGLRSLEMLIDATVHIERLKSTININIPLEGVSIIDAGKSHVVFTQTKQWLEGHKNWLSQKLKEKEIV